MQHRTDDLRIEGTRPLLPPAILMEELPLDERASTLVWQSRAEIARIIHGADDRLLVVVGPCSVHDTQAALEYAGRLARVAERYHDELCIVMRVYFEKPRTTVGWKGLINDPHLDGSGDVNVGLQMARGLLLEVLDQGLAIGCEFLDPITPQYISDVVAWGAIGARTTESQIHRQLASGLSMPVGFKNATDGDVKVAVDAVRAAAAKHAFAGIETSGRPAIFHTEGNGDGHVILRGGRGAPNYDAEGVGEALGLLSQAGLSERLIVDASHENSGKDHTRQPAVVADIADQVAAGNRSVESFLVAGKQYIEPGAEMVYGQSITDACMDWETTSLALDRLAGAVRERREN